MDEKQSPESGESVENVSVVSQLALLAKEVMGEKVVEERKELADSLDQVAFAFDTDPDATSFEMETKKVTAVVNLIRTLCGMEPLPEGEEADLSRDLTTEDGKSSVLRVGGKETRFDEIDFSKIREGGERIVQAALASVVMKEPVVAQRGPNKGKAGSCWDWVDMVYKAAGMQEGPVTYQESTVNHGKAIGEMDYADVCEGAWLYIWNGNKHGGEHSVIFEGWEDEERHVAKVISYPGAGYDKPPRQHTVKFEEQRITRICQPKPLDNAVS